MKEMKNGDESLFYTIYRMSPATFDMLHSLVKEKLTKGQCPSREPISSGERLALTLRYLSSGMLVRDAAKAFCVGIETARNIIHETCTVLLEVLSPEYMKTPTEEERREIAAGFCNRWQFSNCVGAVDDKHIQIICPRNCGSLYLNYKGTHSIVLMAVVDSQYLFRRSVENAFGIFVSRWRIYERQINLQPANVEAVVKATCVLHNILSSNAASTYCPPGYAKFQDTFGNVSGGAWRQGPGSTTVFVLEKSKARNCSKVASAVRQEFVKYFNEEGQVPWQWKLPGVVPH
ncbi:hypothetical protein HPB51_024623 [Rhipicephalus microplus]|uniref:DDE Tnp4 domain-containing protein n=1 Tax=Rhipicephalus microplus TaxID=6941 RepID=A0A9J6F6F1_RHIMP|nr:hypothetical protein HPB51_024623 [Rhipicephalus microplus]